MNTETGVKALEFEVFLRTAGSPASRRLRRKQLVPAIVYGPGQKSLALSLDMRTAEKYTKKEYENKIFTFKSNQKDLNGLKVLKKDISYHKLTRKPLHIDFLSLDMAKKVRVNVEVLFTGKAKGVRESGGVFNIIRRNVEVECLPAEIPESFSIDVTDLDINRGYHVSDLNIPEKIKLITDKKASLCTVSEITEEAEKPAEEVQAEAGDATATASTPAEGAGTGAGGAKAEPAKTGKEDTPTKK